MVVRSVVRSPVRNVVQSVFGASEAFNPFQLFTSGAQGAWYDPSDFSTLYQDANGTTPVTAVEQPVRLMLDRSKGLVLGSELVTNGDFSDGTTGWTANTATLSVSSGALLITNTGTNGSAYQDLTTVAGRFYKLQFTCVAENTAQAQVFVRDGSFSGTIIVSNLTLIPGTTYDLIFVAASTTTTVRFLASGVTTDSIAVDNISVRELPGNHALAPNDASRPVLRARYNLLTRTEEFDDAVWTKIASSVTANAAVAPDGTTTADKLIENTDSSDHHIRQTASTAAAAHNFSVYLKNAGRGFALLYHVQTASGAIFNLATGAVTTASGIALATASAVDAGNGWYRCEITITTTAGGNVFRIYTATDATTFSYTGDGTSGLFIWGASVLTAADQSATGGAYQRVGAATDYDTGPPWRPYLAPDGADDWMPVSPTVDLGETWWHVGGWQSNTASRNAFALSDVASKGSLLASGGNSVWTWRNAADTANAQLAAGNISVPHIVRVQEDVNIQGAVNGVAGGVFTPYDDSGGTQGLALFSGSNSSYISGFAGRFYGGVWVNRAPTAPELNAMESWIAGKTGVSL